jgi:phosphoribosylaminoimidazole-succinocarboxamide synthase
VRAARPTIEERCMAAVDPTSPAPSSGAPSQPKQVRHLASGKVRDVYAVGDDELLLVASDRISTYDAVHPTPVPDKGRILTAVSAFWFERLEGVTPHHLLSADQIDATADLDVASAGLDAAWLAGRSMRCRRTEVVPFECVVRGHLAGSAWASYRASGEVCGVALPEGLREADALPDTDLHAGDQGEHGAHDENVTFDVDGRRRSGGRWPKRTAPTSLAIYASVPAHAASVGLILADTKFEFGLVDRPATEDATLCSSMRS